MARMTDPTDSLVSFQEELSHGALRLVPGTLDPDLKVFADMAGGQPRMTYARIENGVVTALVVFVFADFGSDGIPFFQVGYAVPDPYRRQGRAKSALRSAIAELVHGFSKTGSQSFNIEAVIGVDNIASQRIAAALISNAPTRITDSVSQLPALQYVREIRP